MACELWKYCAHSHVWVRAYCVLVTVAPELDCDSLPVGLCMVILKQSLTSIGQGETTSRNIAWFGMKVWEWGSIDVLPQGERGII